jgi:uncharacterized protein YdhG (YjbR/CyaY superfamily)
VPSGTEDVDGYIEDALEERREALTALRDACLEELDGFEEGLEYGLPSYSRAGEVEVSFASQKQHISLYILRTDVMAAHRDDLEGLSVGKGAIRYRNPEQIEMAVVCSMLRDTAASSGPVC